MKNIAPYSAVIDNLRWVSLAEAQYNTLFYQTYIFEGGMNKEAFYHRMDILFHKPYTIEVTKFPGYQIMLNPLLKSTQYSKHLFTVTKAGDSFRAVFHTKDISFRFPDDYLNAVNKKDSTNLLIHTDLGIEMDIYGGRVNIPNITGFKMAPFKINHTPIIVFNTDRGKLTFALNENGNNLFESNGLAHLINSYNSALGMGADQYDSSLQFSDLSAEIMLNGHSYKTQITELNFTENLTAGVLKFKMPKKKQLILDIPIFLNGKPNSTIHENFKILKGVSGRMVYTFLQDYQTVWLYFFVRN